MAMRNEVPRLRYDAERLKADVSIREALSVYATTPPQGAKKFLCISPDHADTKPSMQVIDSKNICHCYACKATYNPVALVMERNGVDFPTACRTLIEDFRLNIYEYSNMQEIEAVKGANKSNQFYDFFPVSDEELTFCGLTDCSKRTSVTVTAKEYWEALLPDNTLEGVELYDGNGKNIMKKCNIHDAIKLGLVDELRLFEPKTFSLRELWKEDKELVEEMIINHLLEKKQAIVETLSELNLSILYYRCSHTNDDIKEAEKLREAYYRMIDSGKYKKISFIPLQQDKINDLNQYEQDKDTYKAYERGIEVANSIYEKIRNHQQEREKSIAKQKPRESTKQTYVNNFYSNDYGKSSWKRQNNEIDR